MKKFFSSAWENLSFLDWHLLITSVIVTVLLGSLVLIAGFGFLPWMEEVAIEKIEGTIASINSEHLAEIEGLEIELSRLRLQNEDLTRYVGKLLDEIKEMELAKFEDEAIDVEDPIADLEPWMSPLPVQINQSTYYEMWEYLEYGNEVEFNHPEAIKYTFTNSGSLELIWVGFWVEVGSDVYSAEMMLTPPEFRALRLYMEGNLLSESNYFATISSNPAVGEFHLLTLEDVSGEAVWSFGDTKDPRPLSDLEEWVIAEVGDDAVASGLFDGVDEDGWIWGWSPVEGYARAAAFANYASNPENGVWVARMCLWGDAAVQWIDAVSLEPLAVVDVNELTFKLPESGGLIYQMAKDYTADSGWDDKFVVNDMFPGAVIEHNCDGVHYYNVVDITTIAFLDLEEEYHFSVKTTGWDDDFVMSLLEETEDSN